MKRILIIEDDTTIVEGLETILSHRGYLVFSALTGEEGLELFKKHKPETETDYETKSLTEHVEELEGRLLRQALHKCDGNQSKAARTLKITVQTLRYKMEKLGIE